MLNDRSRESEREVSLNRKLDFLFSSESCRLFLASKVETVAIMNFCKLSLKSGLQLLTYNGILALEIRI